MYDPGDSTDLVWERMPAAPSGLSARKVLLLVALVVLLGGVLVGAGWLLLNFEGGAETAGRVASTATLAATATTFVTSVPPSPTPVIPTPTPTELWKPAGPTFATSIVFGTANPLVGYACGTNHPVTQNSGTEPIALAVTQDGGKTWTNLPSPGNSYGCVPTVDPTDGSDIVIQTLSCFACSPPPPITIYRSTDGGHTWHTMAFPAVTDAATKGFNGVQWAGSTLLATRWTGFVPVNEGNQHWIAASVNKQPFAWIDGGPQFTGLPANTSVDLSFTAGTTIWATETTWTNGQPQPPLSMLKSTDQGATWATVPNFQYIHQTVQPYAATPDGKMIVGNVVVQPPSTYPVFAESLDGGQTWALLPGLPSPYHGDTVYITPNGSMVAAVTNSQTVVPYFLLLANIHANWSTPLQTPDRAYLEAIQVGTNGAPIRFWASGSVDTSGTLQPGLQAYTL